MARLPIPAACFAILLGAFLAAELALPPRVPSWLQAAEGPPGAGAAPSADKESNEELAADQQKLNEKYAETFLRLSEVNLQKAEDFNARVPGAFSAAEVGRLRSIVSFARDRLNWVKGTNHRQSDANIFMADQALRAAEQNYDKAMSANNRVPGAVSILEMERLRLTVELAKMSREKAELVARTNTPVDDVQWELDQLREDVMQLRSRVEAITARR